MSAVVDKLFIGSHQILGATDSPVVHITAMSNHSKDNSERQGQNEERKLHWFRVIIGVSAIVTPLLVAVFAFSAKMYVGSVYDEKAKPIIERIDKMIPAERHEKDLTGLVAALNSMSEQITRTDDRVDGLRTQVAVNYTDILVSLAELKVGIARLEGHNIGTASKPSPQPGGSNN